MTRRTVGRLLRGNALYAAAAVLVVLTAFPFAWMITTALKPGPEIFAYPPRLLPEEPTLSNFVQLFEQTRFVVYFRNSVVVSSATVLLTLMIGTAGAYSLNRIRFEGREQIATLVLFTYMFAPIMIVIPFYVLVRQLGIANTHVALVLAYTAFCLPFCLWLLKTFFQAIPVELEEAALVDGANRRQAVWHVMLPLALPGIIATGIFTFILAWNDYIFVRILITSDTLKTLSVGIADLYNATVIDWGMIMAGSTLITAPVLIVFIYVQRFLIAGWGAGGVKG